MAHMGSTVVSNSVVPGAGMAEYRVGMAEAALLSDRGQARCGVAYDSEGGETQR